MVKKLLLLFLFISSQQLSFASDFNQLRAKILQLINEHRREMGLVILEEIKDIDDVAYIHSQNMAKHKINFGHDGFDNRMSVISAKIKGINAMAENVLFGDVDAEKAVSLWLNSKGHRKNIEGNYNLTGIGIEKGNNDNLYFTMIFIRNLHNNKR